jgi:hypothetical protein
MLIGNIICIGTISSVVMATSTNRVGLDHPTVVPENFEDESDEPTASDRPRTE